MIHPSDYSGVSAPPNDERTRTVEPAMVGISFVAMTLLTSS